MSEGVAARRFASLFTIYGRRRKNNSWDALVYRRWRWRRQQASERANFAAIIIIIMVVIAVGGGGGVVVRHAGTGRVGEQPQRTMN